MLLRVIKMFYIYKDTSHFNAYYACLHDINDSSLLDYRFNVCYVSYIFKLITYVVLTTSIISSKLFF